MKLLLIFIILLIPHIDSWRCGNGTVSENMSFVVSVEDRKLVNECCALHDKHYLDYCKGTDMTLELADVVFANCLNQSKNLWTRYVIRPAFNALLHIYRWVKNALGSSICDL